IKIGSALLTDSAAGTLKQSWLEAIAGDVAGLKGGGGGPFLLFFRALSPGPGGLGVLPCPPSPLETATPAARGRIQPSRAYQEVFRDRGVTAAQILMTPGDTEERRRYLNARNTIETLFKFGAIPVVNENDTVATSEIRYGDNDRLAARVATMITADCLVLLSDIDGLYDAPPAQNPDAKHLPVITAITPEIEAMAGDVGTELSRGGMVTKIGAAKIAVGAGTHMVIASGKVMNPLRSLSEGVNCTWFLASANPVTARKRWIAGT